MIDYMYILFAFFFFERSERDLDLQIGLAHFVMRLMERF